MDSFAVGNDRLRSGGQHQLVILQPVFPISEFFVYPNAFLGTVHFQRFRLVHNMNIFDFLEKNRIAQDSHRRTHQLRLVPDDAGDIIGQAASGIRKQLPFVDNGDVRPGLKAHYFGRHLRPRGYTADDYRRLIHKIRARIPDASIATDIIVGFPGETDEQFQATYDLLAELKMDVAHLARYSTRTGTVADRKMVDDVTEEEKWRRYRLLEELQEGIATEIHAQLLGETVEVLFEEKVKGRWRGRTPTNKLVFVESEDDLRGQVLPVQITWTGPWSMQARLMAGFGSASVPLEMVSTSK